MPTNLMRAAGVTPRNRGRVYIDVKLGKNNMTGQTELQRLQHAAIGSFAIAGLAICLCASGARAQDKAQDNASDYATIIAAPDRTDADRQTDMRRDPLKLLVFTGAHPGMKVLDMGAGGGYSTELMARAVAPTGVVYGQNPADLGERAKARFEARLKTPAGKNIVSLARPFDDPAPADLRDLDLITFLFFYHDTTYMTVDRAEMNRKLYATLKPGAFLVIADHSARPGDGTTVGKTLHRIEEGALRREVEAAGFKLVAQGDFWRHPEDPRDFSVQPPTRPVDEFVLKFQKPM
jgi:predicted methyltransferase